MYAIFGLTFRSFGTQKLFDVQNLKVYCIIIFWLGVTLGLFAQSDVNDSLQLREGAFTFKQKQCDFNGKGSFSMPDDYGSPRDMTSTLYISNDTIAVVQRSSLSSYTFKTIQIPEDSCIYFIQNGRTICFQELQNLNMNLLPSEFAHPFEYIQADTEEIEGFSTILFRQYQVDSSLGRELVDTLYMLGTTEIKSSLNISIEGKKNYSVFPLKFLLKSQYGCISMELTEFEKDIPRDVFIFDRKNVEYFNNLETYKLLGPE